MEPAATGSFNRLLTGRIDTSPLETGPQGGIEGEARETWYGEAEGDDEEVVTDADELASGEVFGSVPLLEQRVEAGRVDEEPPVGEVHLAVLEEIVERRQHLQRRVVCACVCVCVW